MLSPPHGKLLVEPVPFNDVAGTLVPRTVRGPSGRDGALLDDEDASASVARPLRSSRASLLRHEDQPGRLAARLVNRL